MLEDQTEWNPVAVIGFLKVCLAFCFFCCLYPWDNNLCRELIGRVIEQTDTVQGKWCTDKKYNAEELYDRFVVNRHVSE